MESKLTIEQLAKVLGVSRRTIERELEKPDCNIPYNRIGKRKFFYLSEVIYATKVTPIDKKNMIFLLNSILNSECKENKATGICDTKYKIRDIIKFIENKPSQEEKG